MSIILQDANAVLWRLDVTNLAQLSTTVVGSGAASVPVLTDPLLAVAFILGVDTSGDLTLTATSVPTATSCLDLVAPNGTIWDLIVDALGRLVLILGNAGFAVGALYQQDGGYPTPSQPGGPGTVVTSPIQTNDEKTGKFTAGCGHYFNSWEILCGSVCQQPAAIIVCPVCRYISQVVRPYSLINRPGGGYDYIGG